MIAMLARLVGLSPVMLAVVGGLTAAIPASWWLGRWTGWSAGYAAADRAAEIATLQTQIAARDRDLSAARTAAEAERSIAAAAAAARQTAEQRISDYETELARRPANGACALDDVDLDRLRDRAPVDGAPARPAP